jgi:hypothetical protein
MSTQTPTDNKSTLEAVFQLFCVNDPLEPFMAKPFAVGNHTYATDRAALIRCDIDKIDFDYTNSEKPLNVQDVIPPINTSQIIDIDAIDWAPFMTIDETMGDGNEVKCGNCYGEGTCSDDFMYKGKHYDFDYECPVCDGSGYEEEQKQIPTGKKTFDPKHIVKFKDAYFYARRFYVLKKVKDMVGGQIELISYEARNKALLFRIGILEIVLMPCLYNADAPVIATFE